MLNLTSGWPTNLLLDAETADLAYIWHSVTNIELNAQSYYLGAQPHDFIRYVNALNLRLPSKIRIRRLDSVQSFDYDTNFAAFDNIRISPPPAKYLRYRSPDYTLLSYQYPIERFNIEPWAHPPIPDTHDIVFTRVSGNSITLSGTMPSSEVVWSSPFGIPYWPVSYGYTPSIFFFQHQGDYGITFADKPAVRIFNSGNMIFSEIDFKDTLTLTTNITSFVMINQTAIANDITDWPFSSYHQLQTLTLTGCNNVKGNIPDISGLTGLVSLSFRDCWNLTGNIPDISGLTGFTTAGASTTALPYMFSGCGKLTGDIPDLSGLFSPNRQISIAYMFNNCTNLTGTVEQIFSNTNMFSNLYRSEYAFMDTKITGNGMWFVNMPKNAFYNNNLGSTAVGTFRNCTNLTDWAEIPEAYK